MPDAFLKRMCAATAACAIWAALTSVAWSQTVAPDPARQATSAPAVATALGFLSVAYPDLLRSNVAFRAVVEGGTVTVTVREAPPRGTSPSETPPERVLLSAVLEMDRDQTLRRFRADGTFVNSTKTGAFAVVVRGNPGLSDSEVEGSLRAFGGRPVPTSPPVLGQLDAPAVAATLGTNLVTTGSRLKVRDESSPGAVKPLAERPAWTTTLEGTTKTGASAVYDLEFEPFGGRLVAVSRR